MKLKAVITAGAPAQRHLLHQTLATPDNRRRTIGEFLLEMLAEDVDEIGFIIPPGDRPHFQNLLNAAGQRVTLIEQTARAGYANAVLQARQFVGDAPFLHLVGDHFYLADSGPASGLIAELVRIYEAEKASVSAVVATRESQLPYFGAIGGPAIRAKVYQVETVLEKPTPTEAEQRLAAPGLRQGHYLCFFGIHIFTPAMFEILASLGPGQGLSDALQILARRERYLAAIAPGRRFDIGSKYGLLQAQLALGLAGSDREEILSLLLELTAR